MTGSISAGHRLWTPGPYDFILCCVHCTVFTERGGDFVLTDTVIKDGNKV